MQHRGLARSVVRSGVRGVSWVVAAAALTLAGLVTMPAAAQPAGAPPAPEFAAPEPPDGAPDDSPGSAEAGRAAAASRGPTVGLDNPGWAVFTDRAGTRVDYPSNIFTVELGPARRGAGVELGSADGRARLMVYVEPNAENHSPARFVRSNLRVPASAIDYRRITDRFFAVSGVADDDIFYSRCNFPARAAGPMHCIYIAYPRSEERAWDAIVTRISLSLRAPRN